MGVKILGTDGRRGEGITETNIREQARGEGEF